MHSPMKVVQCWDDAVEEDIRLTDILRKHGAKATFNLNPGLHGPERSGPYNEKWKKAIRRLARGELVSVYDGFTIANHSDTHPWPTRIDLDDWRQEVKDGRKKLQDWFQQPVSGFAYPFGDYDDATAAVVADAGHVYGRTVGKQTPCLPAERPEACHPDCHFLDDDFWALYERAKASGCGAFYFWGHSFELYTEDDWTAFDAQMGRIAADKDAVWAEVYELFA